MYNRSLIRPLTRPFFAAALTLAAGFAAHADYQSLVISDAPKAYYRLNDSTTRLPINKNSGSLGAAGNATNDLLYYKGGQLPTGVVHPFPGAIVGDGNRSEFFDYTTRTEVPFNPAFNTPNTQQFTIEAWFYPASDQTGTGQAPINNRYTAGPNRQGWTFFQRRPDPNYTCCDGGLGWNFRMYNGVGGSTPMDIQSLTPYQVGKWQYVVVVYDPVNSSNATLTIYIDGVEANSLTYSGTDPGYAPCTGDHPASEATSGQPNLSIGCYNNANTGLNPFFGAVDEFAWYPSKLTPAQILSHYQNGTNANRTTPYDTLIKSANPVLYLRLDDIAPSADVAVNLGDVRSSGIASHTAEVRHPAAGAVANDNHSGAAAYHNRNGSSTTTMPWIRANNGIDPVDSTTNHAGVPFTFETWLRPMRDQQGGQAAFNNRYKNSGDRTGWTIFQRNPNLTYPSSEGRGWNFRMYSGSGSGGQDVLTDTDYSIGQWSHLVVTWEPQLEIGPVGAALVHDQWSGILTAYFNGVPVATNSGALYSANINPTDDGSPAADLAVGSYNAASGLGANPYEGDVGEVAIYNNYVLTPDQILEHYQAGTNSNYGTNYETLVLSAAVPSPATADRAYLPKTYLRFNDPARYSATNSGTLGSVADGDLVLTTNIATGPQSPAYPGFEASNPALPLDGVKQWASFNNPAGLNIAGQITLEAWVMPGTTQGTVSRIISHGPQTLSNFLSLGPDGATTNTTEVFLKIDGANYVAGSASVSNGIGTNTYSASFPIPSGDLGSSSWIHLVGTYDGANWKLYRNGTLVATQASAVGALPVDIGDWAVGSTGNGWADAFNGTVDEVAIYNYALSASKIKGHYNAGVAVPRLTITRSGSNSVTITWPYGTLYQADNVTGPWTAVAGEPTSPYTVSAGAARRFYRFGP